jgi:septal ring factor EnvC (AmiA/AmiB activator)
MPVSQMSGAPAKGSVAGDVDRVASEADDLTGCLTAEGERLARAVGLIDNSLSAIGPDELECIRQDISVASSQVPWWKEKIAAIEQEDRRLLERFTQADQPEKERAEPRLDDLGRDLDTMHEQLAYIQDLINGLRERIKSLTGSE